MRTSRRSSWWMHATRLLITSLTPQKQAATTDGTWSTYGASFVIARAGCLLKYQISGAGTLTTLVLMLYQSRFYSTPPRRFRSVLVMAERRQRLTAGVMAERRQRLSAGVMSGRLQHMQQIKR